MDVLTMKRFILIDTLILLVCLAIGVKTAVDQPIGRHTFTLDLQSSATAISEVFYDLGEGYQAVDSVEAPIPVEAAPVSVSFELPLEGVIRSLRWDPINDGRALDVEVTKATLSYYGGLAVHELPLESVVPLHQIDGFEVSAQSMRFSVLEGNSDPHMAWSDIPSAPPPPERKFIAWWGALFGLLGGAFLILSYRMVLWYFDS